MSESISDFKFYTSLSPASLISVSTLWPVSPYITLWFLKFSSNKHSNNSKFMMNTEIELLNLYK